MLLDIQNLSVNVKHGATLVDDISLSVDKKKIVGLVGGSGSGKTTTGLSILRLLAPELQINHKQGMILFNGMNLLALKESRMRQIRGKDIGMVFQEPLYAFNPVFTIGSQIEEVLGEHTSLSGKQKKERVLAILDIVGIPDPKRIALSYPHQLSGGLRQRAMIAQAIAVNPKLIIADEPTSNLDVTLQARILELFKKLRQDLELSILLITHDLGVVEHLTDEVAVMSEGRIVEEGKTEDVIHHPKHPYTQQLMKAVEV